MSDLDPSGDEDVVTDLVEDAVLALAEALQFRELFAALTGSAMERSVIAAFILSALWISERIDLTYTSR